MTKSVQCDFESQCQFPAVLIYDDELSVYERSSTYTTCSTTTVRAGEQGLFAKSTLIDSRGKMWKVQGATVLHGVGPLWGWNLFLKRTVKVSPSIIEGPITADLDFVRREVSSRLIRGDPFSIFVHQFPHAVDPDTARQLVPAIEDAISPSEIISILLTADLAERARIEGRA